MGEFIKGDIVVIPFPFSDLSGSKKRPALVIADLVGEDIVLCQITSKSIRDAYAIALNETEFEQGSLPVPSNIRPNRIFTADKKIIIKRVATISDSLCKKAIDKIIDIVQN